MEERIDHELELIRGSIALLAGGGVRRVTLIGLHHGRQVLPDATQLARSEGMVVRAIGEGRGTDLALEPLA